MDQEISRSISSDQVVGEIDEHGRSNTNHLFHEAEGGGVPSDPGVAGGDFRHRHPSTTFIPHRPVSARTAAEIELLTLNLNK